MRVTREVFGQMPNGATVHRWTIDSPRLKVQLIDYGATLVSVETPDRDGNLANVNLGFDSLEKYRTRGGAFGCTVGRYANRIAGGRFTLDGVVYDLPKNIGPNHLHGGPEGFHKKVWQGEAIEETERTGVRFTLISPDGEMGYPGTLEVVAEYYLNAAGELVMDFFAQTDKPTVLNLTNHAYWNLGGAESGNVFDHVLEITAEKMVEVDGALIPTGRLIAVDGTLYDFRQPARLGDRLPQLADSGPRGYDLCYVVPQPGELSLAARVKHPATGRVMEVLTTQPGVQLYTANHLGGDGQGDNYVRFAGLCLETQHFPDSPNHPHFPSTTLRPGERFHERTVHRFLVE